MKPEIEIRDATEEEKPCFECGKEEDLLTIEEKIHSTIRDCSVQIRHILCKPCYDKVDTKQTV